MADVENPPLAEPPLVLTIPIIIPEPAKVDADGNISINGAEETPEAQPLAQVKFYFADANLPYDKFMWTFHAANEEHWCPSPPSPPSSTCMSSNPAELNVFPMYCTLVLSSSKAQGHKDQGG
ncbi:hypothetical protein EI94DRAFT_1808715 [Lactarius quietus]|nr:hypothetical protein EI94DRAFT_1808715 [Lactarius quietus]